jgi:NADH dehydrogenase
MEVLVVILVVGSTGMVGSEICRRLAERGESVRALVRTTTDPARVAVLREIGAQPVIGDLRDAASLERACEGVDAVVSTVSAMPFSYLPGVNDIATTDLEGTLALIGAAGKAGVRPFVYMSFSKNLDTPCPLHDAKRTVEAHLRESGLEYTILRPSCFMEVWLSPAVGFDPENAKATIYGDGTRPLSWIAASDVAEFAVIALLSQEAAGRTIELGGPEAVTPLDAVRVFERVGGRAFEVQHVPVESLQQQLAAATDPMQQSFAGLMCAYANGDRIEMSSTLAEFPVALTSVLEYAERMLGKVPVAH